MPQDIEKLPLIRSTWWASKVQCYVCISALVSLHVRKPTQMSDIACSVHALWRRHGQYACVYFGLKPSHPSVCSMYVMQWYYYSAASFWVMVLFVHHFSVYSSLWLLIHSFYLPSWNCMLCLKPTCYEDTQSSCKSPSYEGISLACAFMMLYIMSLVSDPFQFLL